MHANNNNYMSYNLTLQNHIKISSDFFFFFESVKFSQLFYWCVGLSFADKDYCDVMKVGGAWCEYLYTGLPLAQFHNILFLI